MKLFQTSVLLLLLSTWACQKSVDPTAAVTAALTTPASSTSPVSNTTSVVSTTATLSAAVDLYAHFAMPFPTSATQRIREINIYKDSSLIAKSVFRYNQAGLLASRTFTEGQANGIVSRVVSYSYNADSRLARELVTPLDNNGLPTETPAAVIDYTYTGGLLASVSRKSRVSIYPLSLSGRTTYRYTGQALTKATSINYFSPLCACNTAYPSDSTRQLFSDNTKQATRVDSVWLVCPPGAACSSLFSRQIITQTERDAKGNAMLIQTNTNNQPVANYTYSYEYQGPEGLISSARNQTLGLRYTFVYESK
ncbi:hypothetical protein [Fibrella forsythiae]|uniref:YD repeat-containing protein n=1 Tax=Fibrella forsythiae TaxID=2817061 RepID=A0ABS3JH23_9BACT|nr:hypothetical protein [Fibrella forsythiae]MBO0948703.1 hypothetical protein [Fibrella forsythiae]